MSGLLNKQSGNALYKHVTDVHQGELEDFKMKVVRSKVVLVMFRFCFIMLSLVKINTNA